MLFFIVTFVRVGGFCESENYIYLTSIGEVNITDGKIYRIKKNSKNLEYIDVSGIMMDPKGIKRFKNYFFIADVNGIWKLSMSNMSLTRLIGPRDFPKDMKSLFDIALTNDGTFFVSDLFSDVVYKFNMSGNLKMAFELRRPSGLVSDSSGRIYILTFTSPSRIYVYEREQLKLLLESKFIRAGYGLTIDEKTDKLYATGMLSNNIVEIDLKNLNEREIYKFDKHPSSILFSDNKLYVGFTDDEFDILDVK